MEDGNGKYLRDLGSRVSGIAATLEAVRNDLRLDHAAIHRLEGLMNSHITREESYNARLLSIETQIAEARRLAWKVARWSVGIGGTAGGLSFWLMEVFGSLL